ncbi:MAG: thioredoxin [Clostridia bacterium]|nr:thioredoxin [Clostridia bacterium]
MLNAGIMTNEEFEEIVSSKDVCVIDFSASWCGPCRMMAPIMEDIADKYKGKYYFYQIDIDSAEEIAMKYNITAVPTIVVTSKGKEIGRTSGYQEFDEFERFLNNTIHKADEK